VSQVRYDLGTTQVAALKIDRGRIVLLQPQIRLAGSTVAETPPSVATTTSYPAFVKLSLGKTNSSAQTPPKCF
jgi:hypothetical protein